MQNMTQKTMDLLNGLTAGSVQCVVTRPCGEMETSFDHYVQSLTGVFREVRRVLKDDGVVWLNLEESRTQNAVGIPWMVAFALRADGWYLRSDIIWAKDSLYQEEPTDRPTRFHEYIFLLTKSREYFYDQMAVREPFTSASEHSKRRTVYSSHGNGETSRGRGHGHNMLGSPENGRNRRTVWSVSPVTMVELCIKAGSRPGDTVLDPFHGGGVTGSVSTQLGRHYLGLDSPDPTLLLEPSVPSEPQDVGLVSALELFST